MIFLKRKKYTKLDDESLVEMIAKTDDSHALNELFNRYSLLVMGIGLKYLKNKESAEDMTLELFVKIPEKLKKYEVKKFRSWLHTTARNECLMQLRKHSPEINKGEMMGDIPDETESEFKIEKEAEYTQLEQALNLLKPAQKKCIELFYYKKKCYEEIAAMTSFSIKEVKSHLQNGKRNLKIKIQESDE